MYELTIKRKTLEEISEITRVLNEMEIVLPPVKESIDLPIADITPVRTLEVVLPPVVESDGLTDRERADKINAKVAAKDYVAVADGVDQSGNGNDLTLELDSEGLPYSKEIHAATKGKMKNGTWKKMRGLDQEVYEAGKIKLREQMAQAANPPSVPAVPITAETPVVEAPVAPPVIAPVVEVPVQPTQPIIMGNGHTVETFTTNFPMIVGTLISEGKLTQGYINQLKEYFNVTEIWEVNDEQKAEMFESFSQHGFITKVG